MSRDARALHGKGTARRISAAAGALALVAAAVPAAAAGLQPAGPLPAAPPALQRALDAVRGQAVLVNFWASWCAPCREEMPALAEIDEREPGLALVTVAVADRAADTRRFLDDHLLDEVVVVADPGQDIARAWQARMLPTTYVLDSAHQARYRVVGETDWRAADLQAAVRALLEPPSKGVQP
jgi:thiol-disulfide isomerase/thioredoxin